MYSGFGVISPNTVDTRLTYGQRDKKRTARASSAPTSPVEPVAIWLGMVHGMFVRLAADELDWLRE